MALEVEILRDVAIHPLLPESDLHVPLVHADEDPDLLPHFRFGEKVAAPDGAASGKNVILPRKFNVIKRAADPAGEHSIEPIQEALFGGYLFKQFGHFIAETTTRLWSVQKHPELRSLPILFRKVPSKDGEWDLSEFMVKGFDYFGVPNDKVRVINAPVRVARLHVPSQPKGLGFFDDMDELNGLYRHLGTPADPNLPRQIYVSRSRYIHEGSFLGEEYFEKALQQRGVAIIYPERHSLRDLIQIFRSAKKIGIAEGSAFHVLELAGGVDADVLIIGRRSEDYIKRQFVMPTKALFRDIKYFSPLRTLPSLMMLEKSIVDKSKSLSFHEPTTLIEAFSSFYELGTLDIDLDTLREAMIYDISRSVFDPRTRYSTKPFELGNLMRRLREGLNEIDFLKPDLGPKP